MPAREIKPGVYWIGVNDRTTDLFEGLWPITREGISYNSYVIDGDKKVLVDMAKDFKSDVLLDQISNVIDPAALDYIVINHMEPDHTGVVRILHRLAPQAQIFCTARAEEMLQNFFQISENVHVIEDGETLDLGSHSLTFYVTPMVHWPETMMTVETQHKVLFSCDAFGGYGALQGGIFDDEYKDLSAYEDDALRYYANIVSKFSRPVLKAIDKLSSAEIDVVAPSHGLVWRGQPGRIIELYQKWAQYSQGDVERAVTLIYGTMYGNTEEVVDAVAQGVARAGVPLSVFDVRHTHASYILPSIYTREGVLIGAPTYEGELFPPMAHLLDLCHRKRFHNRKAAYFGSYAWSGGARREVDKWAETLKWEIVESWEFAGGPTAEDLDKAEEFGYRFAQSL